MSVNIAKSEVKISVPGGAIEVSPSELKAFIRLVVTDPSGRVMSDSGEQESHSFVIQFLEFIYRVFDSVQTAFTATDGTEDQGYLAASDNPIGCVKAPINNSNFGIVIGTDDTAEDNTDHALNTQLTEGVTAGKITHNQSIINFAPAVTGGNVDMVLLRSFTNNTGNLITVKEAGVYTVHMAVAGALWYYHCHVRDVLASSVAVADKCSLSVFYTLRTTV